ncbi:MAG TPA: hypothetical protein PLM77_09455 [Phycisphaerae bacterium]|nr:hypothetical protein [Phycisphaerae bacterium]
MRCLMIGRLSLSAVLLVWLAGSSAERPVFAAVDTAPASQPASRPARPSPERIATVVRQLSHPAYARRRAAIRQLAEWGPVAFPALRQAAQSKDLETALLARDLLAELQSAILIGAQVRLEVNPPRVPWDEPFTVTVHVFNPTGEPIEAPWPADQGEADDDVRQVAALMDVGDFLVVTGPDGQSLDLRVDPIERSAEVYEAVNLRARDLSPSHPVPAGATDRLVINAFNRGWARYPMLTAGKYTIQFSYQPQWNDPTWIDEGFGLVRSEPATVEIIQSAPEAIRTAEGPLRLKIEPDGESLAVRVESTWDRDQWINPNLGDDLQTQARVEWRLQGKEDGQDDGGDGSASWTPESTGDVFRPELVRRIRPGERMIIGRAPLTALRERMSRLPKAPGEARVFVRYSTIGNAPCIREEIGRKGRTANVPTHLYTGTIRSDSVVIRR